MASLEDQLGWSITTQDYLNDLNKELLYSAGQYNSSIEFLHSNGYIEEYLPKLQANAEEFEREVRDLISYIESDHLAYIQTQKESILSRMEI